MLQRFKLLIEYDGTDFNGWQRQRIGRTVQQELEDALRDLNRGEAVTLIGSGRTDAGVHALGQVAHFDMDTPLDAGTILKALNAKTGRDVNILGCETVGPEFHARFSARQRHYLYRVSRKRIVLDRRTSWQLEEELDENRLHACAAQIIGEHDFSRLSRASSETKLKICRITDSQWIKEDNFINYKIVGNRFLHSMVRMIVGTMICIARGLGQPDDFAALVNNQDSRLKVYTAPARGLILLKVEYGKETVQ